MFARHSIDYGGTVHLFTPDFSLCMRSVAAFHKTLIRIKGPVIIRHYDEYSLSTGDPAILMLDCNSASILDGHLCSLSNEYPLFNIIMKACKRSNNGPGCHGAVTLSYTLSVAVMGFLSYVIY
jgi:hypothetical protein